jgi:hypothetical protein
MDHFAGCGSRSQAIFAKAGRESGAKGDPGGSVDQRREPAFVYRRLEGILID